MNPSAFKIMRDNRAGRNHSIGADCDARPNENRCAHPDSIPNRDGGVAVAHVRRTIIMVARTNKGAL